MKMIIAIVNNDDAHNVNINLSKIGIPVTKIASTGGFLMNGNSTFLMGVNDEDVDKAIDIIAHNSKKRVQPSPVEFGYTSGMIGAHTTEITVGGANIFVMDVEKFTRV